MVTPMNWVDVTLRKLTRPGIDLKIQVLNDLYQMLAFMIYNTQGCITGMV